jgi:dihydrofolate reductase
MKLKLIVAMCKNRGIGYCNDIPWKIKKDLIYFYNKTCGEYGKYIKNVTNISELYTSHMPNKKKNAVIMGKNTWLSLPKYPNPLKNRDNLILSRNIYENIIRGDDESDLISYFSSISHMMKFCTSSNDSHKCRDEGGGRYIKHEDNEMREINQNSFYENNKSKYDELWIIGGSQIYDMFMNENLKNNNINSMKRCCNDDISIHELYITYIDKFYDCDTFFPVIENMNLYYISSFSSCESIDEKTGTHIPITVYYIVFTLIDFDNIKNIKKNYIDVSVVNKTDDKDIVNYYYFTDNDHNRNYIKPKNYESFMWCITKC